MEACCKKKTNGELLKKSNRKDLYSKGKSGIVVYNGEIVVEWDIYNSKSNEGTVVFFFVGVFLVLMSSYLQKIIANKNNNVVVE